MNVQSREVQQKLLGEYSNIHDQWFSDHPAPYTAIAFDSYYPEWGNPQRINLVVNAVSITSEADILVLPRPYVLDITLEEALGPKAKGTSEPIGLIPKTFAYDEERQGIIERNLSDFLVALLYDDILKRDERLIIFQGPFSPKLLGRLGYRNLNHDITLAAITFKNEWFPLNVPEANRRLNQDLDRSRFFIDIERSCHAREKAFYQLADNKPSNGLEEVLKSWIAVNNNRTVFILELFCQFPSGVELPGGRIKSPWITKLRAVQESLRFPGLVFEQSEPIWLPFALACAYDICRHYGRRPFKEPESVWKDYWEYLSFYEEDIEEMYRVGWETAEVVGRRSLLYLAMFSPQIYSFVKEKAGLIPAAGEFDRGMNLSRAIKGERTRGGWRINRWREII
jgi:hypothetical protein